MSRESNQVRQFVIVRTKHLTTCNGISQLPTGAVDWVTPPMSRTMTECPASFVNAVLDTPWPFE